MWKLCASFVFLALLPGCSDSPSTPSGGIPFTTVSKATIPGSGGPQIQTIVRTPAEWSQVWSDLWGAREPARPPVDFSRDMVVVVTASEICFGDAEIEEIGHTGSTIVVRYADSGPTLCLCIQAQLTYHAVRAPRLFGDARFDVRQTPTRCPPSS